MRKLLTILAALAASLVGVPAHADTASFPVRGGSVTLTIPDAIVPATGSCAYHYGTLAVAPAGSWDWSADLAYSGPSSWPSGDYAYGTGTQTQTVSFLLCPAFDQPGAYTASAVVEINDYDPYTYETIYDSVTVTDAFTISRPYTPPPPPPPAPTTTPTPTVTPVATTPKAYTSTRLTVSDRTPNNNQRITFTIKSKKTSPTAGPNGHSKVELRFQWRGRWHRLDTLRTNSRGLVKVPYRWNVCQPISFRAMTIPSDEVRKSTSSKVRVTIARSAGCQNLRTTAPGFEVTEDTIRRALLTTR